MDLIYVNLIKLYWINNNFGDKIIDNPIIKRQLKKPFKLGEIITVVFNKNKEISYKIQKVATKYNDYEILENGEVKVSNNYDDKSTIISDNAQFKGNVFTKFIIPRKIEEEIKIFGMEDREKKIQFYLNQKVFSMIALISPIHGGKQSFLKKIEQNNEDKHFIRLDCKLVKVEAGYMTEILILVRLYQRNVVLCIVDAHLLELNESLILVSMIKQYKTESRFNITVILTCTDIDLLHRLIRELIRVKIPFPGLNKEDKLHILQQLISMKTGRNKFEDGLDLFAATLSGYTAHDINQFIKLSFLKDPSLSLEQLRKNINNKMYAPKQLMNLEADIDRLRWSEIGGYDYIKELLIENVQEPILTGGKIVKGILLHGPPGCSKTMFARALSTECDLNIFIVKPTNILCSLVGESEAKLRNILQVATISAPSIVFIDEIDTLLPKKDAHDDSPVTGRLLNELLVFLDGIESKEDNKVIFMAATNRLNLVDEALKRSGRIDLVIKVDLPDQSSIESILRIALSDEKFNVDSDVFLSIPAMVKKLTNKSGAEIVHAVRRMKSAALKDFERNNLNMGLPTLSMQYVIEIMGPLDDDISQLLQSLSVE